MINLKELKTLVAIADYGTFAKAGQAIFLTQSAVSLHVKSLEVRLGVPLFDRMRRPPAMNEKGVLLVKKAREILILCEQLEHVAHDSSLAGTLRIGAVPTVMTGVLPIALSAMRVHHPDLMIEVTSGLSAALVAKVHTAELDAVIVTEPLQLGRGLSWKAFVEEPLVVIAPESANGKSGHDFLSNYPFIRFQPETWAGQYIESVMRENGFSVQSLISLDSLESISKMVSAGLGVSVVPYRKIENPFPSGLQILPFGKKTYYRAVGIVERLSSPKASFVTALFDILLDSSLPSADKEQ